MMQRQVHAETSRPRPLLNRPNGRKATERDDRQNEFAGALLLIIVALMIVQGAIYFEDLEQLLMRQRRVYY